MSTLKGLKKHWKPNQYLVCPAGHCQSDPDRVAAVYKLSAPDLAKAWLELVEAEPRVTRVSVNGLFSQHYQRTPLMRFRDNIDAEIIPVSENTSSIAIYSRATLGVRDFGVNKKRIDEWLGKLEQKVAKI